MISILIAGGTEKEREDKVKTFTGAHPASAYDQFVLDSPTSIGIDEIRHLKHSLSLKAYKEKGIKTAIVKNAQNLTPEAQNALLKTLEEPPRDSQIILLAPNSETLLPTVVSRCQIVKLSPKPQVELSQEQFSQYLNILISFLSSSIGERFKKIDDFKLSRDRQKAIEWVDTQTVVVREMLFDSLTLKSPKVPKSPQPFLPNQLLAILKSLLRTKTYLEANVNIRLALDNFLLDLP